MSVPSNCKLGILVDLLLNYQGRSSKKETLLQYMQDVEANEKDVVQFTCSEWACCCLIFFFWLIPLESFEPDTSGWFVKKFEAIKPEQVTSLTFDRSDAEVDSKLIQLHQRLNDLVNDENFAQRTKFIRAFHEKRTERSTFLLFLNVRHLDFSRERYFFHRFSNESKNKPTHLIYDLNLLEDQFVTQCIKLLSSQEENVSTFVAPALESTLPQSPVTSVTAPNSITGTSATIPRSTPDVSAADSSSKKRKRNEGVLDFETNQEGTFVYEPPLHPTKENISSTPKKQKVDVGTVHAVTPTNTNRQTRSTTRTEVTSGSAVRARETRALSSSSSSDILEKNAEHLVQQLCKRTPEVKGIQKKNDQERVSWSNNISEVISFYNMNHIETKIRNIKPAFVNSIPDDRSDSTDKELYNRRCEQRAQFFQDVQKRMKEVETLTSLLNTYSVKLSTLLTCPEKKNQFMNSKKSK